MNPSWRNVSSIWKSNWKAARLVKPWRNFSLTGEPCFLFSEHFLNAFWQQGAVCVDLGILSQGTLKDGLSVQTVFQEGSGRLRTPRGYWWGADVMNTCGVDSPMTSSLRGHEIVEKWQQWLNGALPSFSPFCLPVENSCRSWWQQPMRTSLLSSVTEFWNSSPNSSSWVSDSF